MQRFPNLKIAEAPTESQPLLEAVQSKLGMVPNMMASMAVSPALLGTYLSSSQALSEGKLSAALREQIALAVSERNGCEYCKAAHSAVGRMAGLSEDQVRDARLFKGTDGRSSAVLHFVSRLLATRGAVADEDLASLRDAGVSTEEIAEIIANVAVTFLTNFFNRTNQTIVDFPAVESLEATAK